MFTRVFEDAQNRSVGPELAAVLPTSRVWNLFFAIAGSLSVDLIGRRVLFLGASAGMLVSYIFISALSATFAETGRASTGIATISFLFIMYGFFSSAYTPLLVAYPVEIWPYQLRARGLAVGLISSAVANFFNIFVNPIALEAIAWKYYIVYCVILAGGGAVIYFTFPETRGHSLEDMTRIFDGDDVFLPPDGQMTKEITDKTIPQHKAALKPDNVEHVEHVERL